MPIKFKTKHSPDILMLESSALGIIKLMGLSGAVPSALQTAEIPAALEKLKAAVAAAPKQSHDMDGDGDDSDHVSLSNRAMPLVEMLEKALHESDYVIWEKV